MNIAVTGVGGGVGQSIVKALQSTEYDIVGINSEELGVGLYAIRRAYLGLYAKDPQFVEKLVEICKKENCTVIFPGLDAELAPLSDNTEKLKKNGILPIVSNPSVVSICGDKLKTYEFLKNNNFPCPKTYRLKDYSFELDFPVVLKPQKGGHRSIGEFVVSNRKELEKCSADIDADNYVVQECVEGDEYTCGTVSFEDHCVGAILMKRELRAGDTYRAFVLKDEKLSGFVKKVINTLKPFGACNVQLRMREGVPYIFEFNARCSGTTASRALAGFNEPKMICDYVSKGVKNPHFEIREIAILRYWKELVVDYDKIEEMKSKGFVENEEIKL
jgi:carbamoyl-phosphate synthase large subunit